MHHKNNILVFLLAASCLLSQTAYAAGVGAIDAINTHDMDFLKQKQRQQTEFQDFQELKKREAEEKAKQENPDNDDKKKQMPNPKL